MYYFLFIILKKFNLQQFVAHHIKPDDDGIYDIAEYNSFPLKSNLKTLHNNLSNSIREFNEKNKIQKIRFMTFIISEDGQILNLSVSENFAEARKLGLKQAVNHFDILPKLISIIPNKWNPAIHLNVKVKQRLIIPFYK